MCSTITAILSHRSFCDVYRADRPRIVDRVSEDPSRQFGGCAYSDDRATAWSLQASRSAEPPYYSACFGMLRSRDVGTSSAMAEKSMLSNRETICFSAARQARS